MASKDGNLDSENQDDKEKQQLPDIFSIFPDLQNMPTNMMLEIPKTDSSTDKTEKHDEVSPTKNCDHVYDPEILPYVLRINL